MFLDILNTTNNPAFALQALSTTLNQIQVFDRAYKWSQEYPATFVFSGKFSIPVRKIGLGFVAGIVVVHIILTGTTIALFLLHTRATLLRNAWQSVAQVVLDQTLGNLSRADVLKDDEIKQALSNTTCDSGASTGAIRRRQNGRNEFGSTAFG